MEAERLYPEADMLFRHLVGVQRLASDLRNGHSGLLRIGASSSLGLTVLPEATSAFLRDYPGVKVVLHNLPAAQLTEMAITRQIDLGMTISPINAPSGSVETIGEVEVVCIMAPDNALASRDEISAADTVEETLITYSLNTHFGRLIARFLDDSGVVHESKVEIGSSILGCPLAARGAGIAFVDELTAGLSVNPIIARPLNPRKKLSVNTVWSNSPACSLYTERFPQYLRDALGKILNQNMRGISESRFS